MWVGGRVVGPEEDCGGPWAYIAHVDHHRIFPPWENLLAGQLSHRDAPYCDGTAAQECRRRDSGDILL